MTTTADVLVLGGGIAGLTIALAAADRGLSVVVLDTPKTGAASRAAAGMLAPSVEELPPEMLVHALAARDFYPGFLQRLTEQTGIEVPLDRSGILQLVPPEDLLRMRAHAPPTAEWLDEEGIAAFDPDFTGHPGALFHPDDGAVDNLALMDALERAVGRVASINRVAAEVLSIDATQRSALTRTRGRFFASSIVLAVGAWAGAISGLPRQIAVRPVRGQLLRLEAAPPRHVTYGGGGYLVPRNDTVIVGATSEEAGFENETSLAGLSLLRNIAARNIPALAGALVVDHWAGLRPMSADGHPVLGPDPLAPSLFYACGYSRNGILFGPWAAEQIALAVAGEPAPSLASFSVDRTSLTVAS